MQLVLGALAGLLTATSALFTVGFCRMARAGDDAIAVCYKDSDEHDVADPVAAGARQ